jgi:hypothetical protein
MLADPSGHLITGIAVSNSAEIMDVRPLCLLCAVCVAVFATVSGR